MPNPIETITEPSFTNSAKGLMTLFMVGLIKITIGISFVGAEISIPWIPKISLIHLDRIILLYWAIVAYSIYRYFLYNIDSLFEQYYKSMHWCLDKSWFGKRFLHSYLVNGDDIYSVKLEANKPYARTEQNDINIHLFEEPDSSFATYTLSYVNSLNINRAHISFEDTFESEIKPINDAKIKKSWGFKYYQADENSPYDSYSAYRIESFLLKTYINVLNVYGFFNYLFRSSKLFDLFLPVILLLTLFITWAISSYGALFLSYVH